MRNILKYFASFNKRPEIELKKNDNRIIEFTILFYKYKERIYNYALKMLNDKMRAEDIVQDVFIKLFENLDYINNKQSVCYWLFKTARNELMTFFRSTKNKKLISQTIALDDVVTETTKSLFDEIENQETCKLILAELENMNEDFKEVFVLKEYSGLSYKEIAALLSIDEELVKSRLYKARQKLITKISKLVE